MLRLRFAPTPSGFLHIGNAFSFVLTWLIARKNGGSIYLRIDDIDGERAREAYIQDIFETIDWLGLDYDSGAQGVADFYQYHSQQLRLEEYEAALAALREQGLLFACTCSRAQLQGGSYSGFCLDKNLDFGTAGAAWRIRSETAAAIGFQDINKGHILVNLHQNMPYFVLRTKQQRAAYQLVSLLEDIRHDVNYIVRGEDLLDSTAAQVFLSQQSPAWAAFSQTKFLHHGLWCDESGAKLSKSQGAAAIRSWREQNADASGLFVRFSQWLGLETAHSAQELLQAFQAF